MLDLYVRAPLTLIHAGGSRPPGRGRDELEPRPRNGPAGATNLNVAMKFAATFWHTAAPWCVADSWLTAGPSGRGGQSSPGWRRPG